MLSFIEPIREAVRQTTLRWKFEMQHFLELNPNWLNKWIFHEMDQSEIVLESP